MYIIALLLPTSPHRLYGVRHSLPQKYTPALKVSAVAYTHPSARTAPTFRLKVSLRSMLSCLLLWLRHSSRQLLCPANPPLSVVLHYTTLRFVR